ncbi:hypothetical protein C8J57DRAFT_1164233 [Mycena rebaudengoi]|nr:hypothetical protein C8J57DRAFT_1164233 [Mycena rebaudengoi]
MCGPCRKALRDSRQPLESMANFQYYAHDELPLKVKAVFHGASMYDIMMVARCRATRITHLFKKAGKNSNPGSQGYSKGNVAIFAQDVATVRTVLPQPWSEIQEAMCALFCGASTVPSKENAVYCAADLESSQENMDGLFEDLIQDVGVPSGIQLCCLPDWSAESGDGYADRGQDVAPPEPMDRDGLVMEAVGYTIGERTPQDARNMKASAVAWCLDKKQFIKMQSGSKFMSDIEYCRDPYGFQGTWHISWRGA